MQGFFGHLFILELRLIVDFSGSGSKQFMVLSQDKNAPNVPLLSNKCIYLG